MNSRQGSHSPTAMPSHQLWRVLSFNQVHIDGAFNVNLQQTSYAQPQVNIRGDARDLANVITEVSAGVLSITVAKGYPRFGALQLDIRTRQLNSFVYHGKGYINGKNLNTKLLDLVIENSGKTTLQGSMGVRKLELSGGGYVEINRVVNSPGLVAKLSGQSRVKIQGIINVNCLEINDDSWMSLYWIRSRALIVRSKGHGFVELAGIVNRLDVELWDNARFFGRYLRARRVFAKTHQKSIAEISAVQHQHTLATDASDIRIYNLPTMKTDFMAFNGAVLDMRDFWDPYLKGSTVYNK